MPNHDERKKAIQAYKERKEVGGLYRIINTQTGWKSELAATVNMQGSKNRLEFSKKTNACFDKLMEAEWKQCGPEAFEFVEVEILEKKPEQSTVEFREELADLLTLWQEKE